MSAVKKPEAVEMGQRQPVKAQPTKQETAVAKVREFATMDTSFFGSKITADLRVLTWSEFWGQKISAIFASIFSDVDNTALYKSESIEAALAKFFTENMQKLANAPQLQVPYRDTFGQTLQNVYGVFQMLKISQTVGNIVNDLSTLQSYRSGEPAKNTDITSISTRCGLEYNFNNNTYIPRQRAQNIMHEVSLDDADV